MEEAFIGIHSVPINPASDLVICSLTRVKMKMVIDILYTYGAEQELINELIEAYGKDRYEQELIDEEQEILYKDCRIDESLV